MTIHSKNDPAPAFPAADLRHIAVQIHPVSHSVREKFRLKAFKLAEIRDACGQARDLSHQRKAV
ncbi:MAG TPA: hypothetical protein VFM05_10275, partial [Candidatus Saccharimonadales bacterium]|nr:hypothetical protein [Candidatus Saccharimonadales bacterium]